MNRLFAAALLAAVLAACAEEGPACTVEDHGDGTRTVVCVDGTSVTLPTGEGTCTLGVGEDGEKVIVCSDGTTVRIGPDGLPVFPGGGLVAGTVRLYGRDRHGGVTVRSRWTDERAVSDDDGAFSLEVRAGNHDLVFEHPDFEPLVVPAVPAVGPYLLPTAILHPARRLAGDGASCWTSPDETAIAVHTGGARLAVRRVSDGADVSLSELASFPPAWDGDGGALAFLEGQDSWTGEATLVRLDLATGTRTELSSSATRVFPWPGGGLLFLELGAGSHDLLFRWTEAEGPVALGTTQRWSEPRFTADGGAVFFDGGAGQVEWREADGRGAVLDGAQATWTILPAPLGPHVAYQDFGQTLRVLDRRDGTVQEVGQFVSFLEFSPDGKRLLFEREGEAVVRRLDTGEERTLARGWSRAQFVADAGVLIVADRVATVFRPDGRADELAADVAPETVLLSPDRIRLLARRNGTLDWELHPAVGAAAPRSLGAAGWMSWTADSRFVLASGDGGFRKIDVLDGDSEPFGASGTELLGSPDGRHVLWVGFAEERPFLAVHELATGREVRLADGPFDSYGFSADGGAVAFRTCGTLSCDLWYWAGGDAPVPVHDAVWFFSPGRRLLVYRFGPPSDHPEAARSGLWYARLPGD